MIDSLLHDYTIAIRPHNSVQAVKIILSFYENNFQNKKVKTPNAYYTLDTIVISLICTTRNGGCLILAYFMSNNFFIR